MKSEQETEGMVDILEYVTDRYVLTDSKGSLYCTFFGGDQLTREKAHHAIDAKLQSEDPVKRFRGIVPKIEDWHARVTYNQVCFLLI